MRIFVVFLALRIHGKSATFRQHYYPEGGWGWVITFCCFLVNIFTTGLQLSFSVLYLEIIRVCGTICREDKISVGELPICLPAYLTCHLVEYGRLPLVWRHLVRHSTKIDSTIRYYYKESHNYCFSKCNNK